MLGYLIRATDRIDDKGRGRVAPLRSVRLRDTVIVIVIVTATATATVTAAEAASWRKLNCGRRTPRDMHARYRAGTRLPSRSSARLRLIRFRVLFLGRRGPRVV